MSGLECYGLGTSRKGNGRNQEPGFRRQKAGSKQKEVGVGPPGLERDDG
jgi:hypothetical protein